MGRFDRMPTMCEYMPLLAASLTACHPLPSRWLSSPKNSCILSYNESWQALGAHDAFPTMQPIDRLPILSCLSQINQINRAN